MPILLLYALFVFMIGFAARSKGRSAIGWCLFAFFLSPLIAGAFLLLMSDKRRLESPTNLEVEMRNEVIRQKYGAYIRSFKPAFSNSVIHETSIGGTKMRFKDKGKALVYVASIVDQQAALPAPTAQPLAMPASEYRP